MSPDREMDSRILRGLAWEWYNIKNYYCEKYPQLTEPLFSLHTRRELGLWNAETGVMSFNRDFIYLHRWEKVITVLKHEMAHQLVSCVFGADTAPHGPNFAAACKLLRISPQASIAFADFNVDAPITANDRIIHRVHKLLSLAQSGNRHEAEAAMQKAQRLIFTYNLDIIQQDRQRSYSSCFLGECRGRIPREDYMLTRLLADYYFVHVIRVHSYCPKRDKAGVIFELTGTATNLEIACYVYDFVRRYIAAHWQLHKPEYKQPNRRGSRIDFAIGIIQGFRDKLAAAATATTATADYAIIHCSDPQLNNYVDWLYPRRATVRQGARQVDHHARRAGYRKGHALVIHKGVTNAAGSRCAGLLQK